MAFPATAPNASSLPYSVRRKGGALTWWIVSSGVMLLAPVVFMTAAVGGDPSTSALRIAIGAAMLGVAVLGALRLWRLKDPEVVLFADRLERPGLLSPRVLYRSDIVGVSRTIYSRSGSYFKIVPRPGGGDLIVLTASLRDDPVFADWLRGFPDSDAAAAAADKASVLADDRYGQTERDRAARLEFARRIVLWFSIACAAAAAAVGFLHPPPLAALGIAIACLGAGALLISLFNGLVIWLPQAGVRPSPIAALIPAGALALRGLLTVHLLATEPLMIAAGVVGVAAALLAFQWRPVSTRPFQLALVAGVAMALLVYGGVAYVDALSAASPSHSYVVAVEDKSVSHGRSTTYYLALAPWGDQPARRTSVSSALYDAVDAGSNVCIDQYRGDLGIPWFDIGLCRALPQTAHPG